MTDNELLLAISNMMDTKLKSELQPIRNEMHVFKNEVRNELKEVKEDVRNVKEELREVKEDVQHVKEELQEVKEDVQNVKDDLRNVKAEVHCIKLYQENITLPRLNTIEACYTDTYRRYASYTEKIEAVFEDVRMLKIVVAEHSEKLRKLA